MILMAFIFSFIDYDFTEIEITVITVIVALVGAALGGFLVAAKTNTRDYRSHMLIGGITGLLSFIFSVIYFLFFLRLFTGGTYLLTGFLIGGCLGGAIRYWNKKALSRY
jgi:MFS-type transporter involved in bile tolerance (Atg22 family)